MGAISGILSFSPRSPIDPLALRRMSDAQQHRGVDADGMFISDRIGLASRRQTFAGGTGDPQTVSNSAGAICIGFCGELFNRRELREDLSGRGLELRHRGDAEIVLRAYEADGSSCIGRFNGQFALAIWDGGRGRLLLARDPLGICPLHYLVNEGYLLFASEAKGVLAHPSVETTIDDDAVAEMLLCGTVFDDRTIFASVNRVAPGSTLEATSDRQLQVRRYWVLPQPAENGDITEQAAAEELAAVCSDAVRLRTAGSTNVGILLSGGTDSSAMAAWAQRAALQPIHTFSIDFPNPWKGNDTDQHYANLVASTLGTTHHSFTLDTKEYFDALEPLAWHLEKAHNKGAATMYLAARSAAPHARVLLSGEGIDEMLGGYVGSRGLWPDESGASPAITHFPWAPDAGAITGILSHDFGARTRAEERFQQRLRDSAARAGQSNALAVHLHLYTTCFLQDLLELHDQAALAAGVELRGPFLDRRCVELIGSLPSHFKVRNGVTKYIFRKVIAGLVPNEVLSRRKTYLPMPFDPVS